MYMDCNLEHASLAALRICVFAFLLIETSSRKAVPEVTSTFLSPFTLKQIFFVNWFINLYFLFLEYFLVI